MGKRRNGLTEKQKSFAVELAGGSCSLTQAYKRVYNAENMSPAVIRNEASKLAGRRDITVMVNNLVEERKARDVATTVSDRELILESLREWIRTAVPADSAKQRAAELLAKITGLLTEKIEVSQVERTPADVVAEIERRLSALPGNSDKNTPEVPEMPENTLIN